MNNILQAHAGAILDRLEADNAVPPLVVQNGLVDDGQAPPYVLVYLRMWTPSSELEPDKVSFEKTSDVITTAAYCHSVGGNPTASWAVAGRVRAMLLGFKPAVSGRVCFPIRHDDSTPANRDEKTGPTVFDQVDVYSFTSLPG